MFPELEGKRRKLAQMNWSLDLACGRIVQKLHDLGLEENTLVIFTNDNGGPTSFCGTNIGYSDTALSEQVVCK